MYDMVGLLLPNLAEKMINENSAIMLRPIIKKDGSATLQLSIMDVKTGKTKLTRLLEKDNLSELVE